MCIRIGVAGTVVGQAIADHPEVRKVGFTGSTEIGKTVMERYSMSLKYCHTLFGVDQLS